MNCNEEVTIKLIGKLSSEFPELDQFKIRNVVDQILVNYEIYPVEKSLVASDIEEKIQYFLAVKKLDGASPLTIKNYKLQLLKFASFFHKTINSITTIDIRMYLAIVSSSRVKKTTLSNKISILKSFFGWLESEEMILKNPMRKIKNIKIDKHLRKSLTQDELELLRDACKTIRQHTLLEVLFSTGCRLSEAVNINIEDIKWDKGELNVIGKGSKERTVYLNSKAKLYIKKYLKERDKKGITNNALFISSKYPYGRLGNRAIEREMTKIAEAAGFSKSIYPHLIRHTTATLALFGGMKITSIQKILGHENLDTTMIYSEVSNDDVRSEFKKLNQ
ncbi:integrase [Clostridium autoethanogenum]|uniref:Integrase n=1 Tax=Clostridium autoethanogenum TaxID=84023 RepID=A0A3M0T466_9CLOT|nr:site-specific tyrosine recombinase/integron integrase [Clostridium autoethanogenum]RMD04891.1 integrase [Clostridium autoethanogenum]